MSQYFDKTFWKFLLGFVTIIAISCTLIIATRLYQSSKDTQPPADTIISKP